MELSEEDFWARLSKDADILKREEPNFKPIDNDVTRWRGFIIGTDIFDGGIFVFELHVPRQYPFKPPTVKILTPIWHPNFSENKVCVGILGKDWTPANTLVDVIEVIRFLLLNPNPNSPLNGKAASQVKNNIEEYKAKVQEYIKLYAGWDQLQKYGL